MSVISVSVVRTIAAIDAAFWRADRVTLRASTIPFLNMSPYSLFEGVVAVADLGGPDLR